MRVHTLEMQQPLKVFFLTLVASGRRTLLRWWSVVDGLSYLGGQWEKNPLTLAMSGGKEFLTQVVSGRWTLLVSQKITLLHWWSVEEGPFYIGDQWKTDLLTLVVSRRAALGYMYSSIPWPQPWKNAKCSKNANRVISAICGFPLPILNAILPHSGEWGLTSPNMGQLLNCA